MSVLYTTVLQDFRTLESDMEYYSLKEYVTLSGRSQDSRVKTVIKLTDPKYNNFCGRASTDGGVGFAVLYFWFTSVLLPAYFVFFF